MAKFNEVQKKRRAVIAQRKRVIHGNPLSGKLKRKAQPLSISGKRKRKLFKKWRRDQKEAIEKGVITMQDVEMTVADAAASDGKCKAADRAIVKFPMKKKSSKLKLKQLKKKGRNNRSSDTQAAQASTDAMVE